MQGLISSPKSFVFPSPLLPSPPLPSCALSLSLSLPHTRTHTHTHTHRHTHQHGQQNVISGACQHQVNKGPRAVAEVPRAGGCEGAVLPGLVWSGLGSEVAEVPRAGGCEGAWLPG